MREPRYVDDDITECTAKTISCEMGLDKMSEDKRVISTNERRYLSALNCI